MSKGLIDLISILDLEQLEVNLFRGNSPKTSWQRVFGGQVIGQAMISGAVAGLGTITPASGFVAPWHGVIIGVVAGALCFWACTWLKQRFKYDDSLDVFGVHGIGGLTGTLLVGVFAVNAIGGTAGLIEGNAQQVPIQLYGISATPVWSGGITFVLLKLVGVFAPLRVSVQQELEGLDISQHGEALQ